MHNENKIIYSAIAMELVVFFLVGLVNIHGGIRGFYQDATTTVERIPRIGLIETGIERDEMLVRFDMFAPADYMEMYYDDKYKTDVTTYYYRIDEDNNMFLKFVYSFKDKTIVDYDMVRGYRGWRFRSYGS